MKRNAIVRHSCILCGRQKPSPDENFSFFSFPKAESVQKQWREKCQLPEGINVSSSRLCSRHFRDEDYSNVSGEEGAKRARLLKKAVPSIFFSDSTSSTLDQATPEGPSTSRGHWSSPPGQYCMVCKKRTVNATKRLPKNEIEREEWMQFFNFTAEDIAGKNVRICERHFEKKNIHVRGLKVELKQFAESDECTEPPIQEDVSEIPSVESPHLTEEMQVDEEAPTEVQPEPCAQLQSLPPVELLPQPIVQLQEEPTVMPSTSFEIPSTPSTSTPSNRCGMKNRKLRFPRYPNDIRTPHLSTPRRARKCLDMTREVIEMQKKKLKVVNEELRKAKKKIANLSEIISHLQKEAVLSVDMKDLLMVRADK